MNSNTGNLALKKLSCCQCTAATWQLRGSEMPKIIKTQEGAAQEAYKKLMQYYRDRALQSQGANLLSFARLLCHTCSTWGME